MTAKKKSPVDRYVDAIVETVLETGGGPESYMYLAFQPLGITLDDWNKLKMLALATGKVKMAPGPRIVPA